MLLEIVRNSFETHHQGALSKILSPPLAERLIRMARFRNLLIHQYGDVDDRKVYAIICSSLEDLNRYLAELAAFLKTSF